MKYYLLVIAIALVAAALLFVLVQALIIRYNGANVPAPEIPREVQTYGSGKPISYVVMGDSTAISQGSEYDEGFAVASAERLGKHFTVRTINTGISGATTEEIRDEQLEAAVAFKPDVVLLAAGANDATHFVPSGVTKRSVQAIVDELQRANLEVLIIVTGSPAMDSVSRFPEGSRQIMHLRTRQVNSVFEELIKTNNLIHAPIAQQTREAFLADPTLTAADNFHPNARGYALWIPVINEAIDEAVQRL